MMQKNAARICTLCLVLLYLVEASQNMEEKSMDEQHEMFSAYPLSPHESPDILRQVSEDEHELMDSDKRASHFDPIMFKRLSHFDPIMFKRRAHFDPIMFKRRAHFDPIMFKRRAHFDPIMFKRRAHFDPIMFKRRAYFDPIMF
ncbi:hypothetical protein CLF_106202 [Clonorchis sinensis]|uniref:Uncharacterized protein n=1 Tax=Clonorchis sinensis TaxID=79923 RepID=H2KRF2_CLOSI|nr:hypothetical protein CLF_106202 [Clonorchis sinensis]